MIIERRLRGVVTQDIFGPLSGRDGIVSEVTVYDSSGEDLGTLPIKS